MKSVCLFISIFLLTGSTLLAQRVAISPDGSEPHPSAALDVQSTTGGFLLPRMNTTQRDAINDPAQGLMIYNTTSRCLEFWEEDAWHTGFCLPCLPPVAPTADSHIPSSSSIQWQWQATPGADGYKWSLSDDYSGATDLNNSTSFNQEELTCATPYSLYVWAYNACGESSAAVLNQSTSACWACGDQLTINHNSSNGVAPESRTVTYGTVLTSISGESKCWITQNLGALYEAASSIDDDEDAAGWYWQFNLPQGYKDGPYPAWTITSINEDSDWLISNDPCRLELGEGWRIPSYAEWNNANTGEDWQSHVDTYNSVLKLHAAGYLDLNTGQLWDRGEYGDFWVSDQSNNTQAACLETYHDYSEFIDYDKTWGINLRCIKD